MNDCLTPKMKALRSFETSVVLTRKQPQIPEKANTLIHCCDEIQSHRALVHRAQSLQCWMHRSAKTARFRILFWFDIIAVSFLAYFVLVCFDIKDISGTYVLSNLSTFWIQYHGGLRVHSTDTQSYVIESEESITHSRWSIVPCGLLCRQWHGFRQPEHTDRSLCTQRSMFFPITWSNPNARRYIPVNILSKGGCVKYFQFIAIYRSSSDDSYPLWRWMHRDTSKVLELLHQQRRVTSQKIWILRSTAVNTQNLKSIEI